MTCCLRGCLSSRLDLTRMAPFEAPEVVSTGLKERIESLSLQGTVAQLGVPSQLICYVGDHLYLGTANGNLSVYGVVNSAGRYQPLIRWAIYVTLENRRKCLHRDPFGDQEELHKESHRPAWICEGYKFPRRTLACVWICASQLLR